MLTKAALFDQKYSILQYGYNLKQNLYLSLLSLLINLLHPY